MRSRFPFDSRPAFFAVERQHERFHTRSFASAGADAGRIDAATLEIAAIYAKARCRPPRRRATRPRSWTRRRRLSLGWPESQSSSKCWPPNCWATTKNRESSTASLLPATIAHSSIFCGSLSRRDRLGLLQPILRVARPPAQRDSRKRSGSRHHGRRSARGGCQATCQGAGAIGRGRAAVGTHGRSRVDRGAVVRIGDTVYDGSVAWQLQRLESQMINRSVHEIQSRRDRFRHSGGN